MISKLINNYYSSTSREIGTKRKNFGIPVVVIDLKTKQSYEYVSIAEAARFFNTHPKTIWRIVYHNKLYLNRYQVIEKKESGVLDNISKLYGNICKYYSSLFNFLKSHKVLIYRILLFVIVSIFIFVLIYFIVNICKDIYDEYLFSLRESRANINKCILEHKLNLNNVLKGNKTAVVSNKSGFINIKEWRYEYIFDNKWISIYNTKKELGVYQSIINEINLDFNAKGTGTFSGINSSYSSPLIERVNINSIFSNAIASTNVTSDMPNSLGIQGINYNPINSVLFDNLVINTRVRSTELLNYQSNILYCLINGLSPSIY